MRDTFISRDVHAGCFVCHGTDAHWRGPNAQGVAARHHDATGHSTWCDVSMSIRYGRDAGDDRQTDLEDAIAASSSGSAPVCAPLTDPDAPAAGTASVSAPFGRPVETRARGRKPETAHV